ncbi:hypothetical protein ACI79G_16220 [Geodermatophilus sp. SYSU D00779]
MKVTARSVVVALPAADPGYGTLKQFASAAAEVIGCRVTVIADGAPAAAGGTTPL